MILSSRQLDNAGFMYQTWLEWENRSGLADMPAIRKNSSRFFFWLVYVGCYLQTRDPYAWVVDLATVSSAAKWWAGNL